MTDREAWHDYAMRLLTAQLNESETFNKSMIAQHADELLHEERRRFDYIGVCTRPYPKTINEALYEKDGAT